MLASIEILDISVEFDGSVMNLTPKTIQIFLPNGEPRGIRIAELTTRILQVFEVPRHDLSLFLQMPESNQVGVYFLIGEGDGIDSTAVYIGQTGDLKERLKTHNKKKDFWDRALIVISKTNSLTQTHALFLEWLCIQEVRKADRFTDKNENSGSRPHTPAPLEADCLEMFDTASTLLATLGQPLFLPLNTADDSSESDEIFYCTKSGADGRGIYTNEGFVVLKGSNGRTEFVDSIKDTATGRARQKLIDTNIMQEESGRLVFQRDHLFSSPSAAAMALMGRTANGWITWEQKDGKTLDELKRQNDAAT